MLLLLMLLLLLVLLLLLLHLLLMLLLLLHLLLLLLRLSLKLVRSGCSMRAPCSAHVFTPYLACSAAWIDVYNGPTPHYRPKRSVLRDIQRDIILRAPGGVVQPTSGAMWEAMVAGLDDVPPVPSLDDPAVPWQRNSTAAWAKLPLISREAVVQLVSNASAICQQRKSLKAILTDVDLRSGFFVTRGRYTYVLVYVRQSMERNAVPVLVVLIDGLFSDDRQWAMFGLKAMGDLCMGGATGMCTHVLDAVTAMRCVFRGLELAEAAQAAGTAVDEEHTARVEDFFIAQHTGAKWLRGQVPRAISNLSSPEAVDRLWETREIAALLWAKDPTGCLHDTIFAALVLGRAGCVERSDAERFARRMGKLPVTATAGDGTEDLHAKYFAERAEITGERASGRYAQWLAGDDACEDAGGGSDESSGEDD